MLLLKIRLENTFVSHLDSIMLFHSEAANLFNLLL